MPGHASADSELRELERLGLLRSLHPLDSATGPRVQRDGRELWNFGANDYLGLATHPALTDSFREGLARFGAGAAASRLTCGSLPPHQALEQALAAAKQAPAAVLFSSGYAAALGTLPALARKGDTILLDKLCHACLIDGARLSGATLRVFPHNDLNKLERLLRSTRARSSPDTRILVVTEAVFSMDGDLCPLAGIVALKQEHDAILLLDEAHSFGVLGPTGMGLAEHLGLQTSVDLQLGTLGKAAGLAGAYVATSRSFADLLVNRARSFVYSTAPPPALAHAALASLNLIRSPQGAHLRARLADNIALLPQAAARPCAVPTPIVPVVLGDNTSVRTVSDALARAGFLVPAIRYPTVPRGTARLRISLSAAHPPDCIAQLSTALDTFA